MTREEAIKIINNFPVESTGEREAVILSIKALEQEPCEDAVNRILKRMWNCRGKNTTSIDKVKMEQIIRDELPFVIPLEDCHNKDCLACVLDKVKAEIREWYWQADKQALAKDPCVVDAMIDLFIRTINKYKAESEDTE